MGQDIHAFVVYDTDRDFAAVDLGRDYYLFALLRGDRGVPRVVPPPRGLPESLSPDILKEHLRWQDERAAGATTAQTLTGRILNDRYGCYLGERAHVVTHATRGKEKRRLARPVAIPGRRSSVALFDGDRHSAGWLTLPELERVAETYRTTPDYGVFTAAWLEGHRPRGHRDGWRMWRFYPQGTRLDLQPIPWWADTADVPGPLITERQDLLRLLFMRAIGGGTEHERLVVNTFKAEGAVRLQRFGRPNGVLGPHPRLEATVAAMRCLPNPRLVFSFDN